MANENGNVDLYNLLHSEGDLWKSSTIAAIKAAIIIQNESPTTDHHEAKISWATQVLANPDQWISDNKWKIIENKVISTGGHKSIDGNIENVVTCLTPAPSADIVDKVRQLNIAAGEIKP